MTLIGSNTRELLDMDNELLQKSLEILLAEGAREVYVFGSAVRGGADARKSDVDLAVRGLPAERFFRAVHLTSAALARPVDIVDLDEPSPFTRHLEREGLLHRVG